MFNTLVGKICWYHYYLVKRNTFSSGKFNSYETIYAFTTGSLRFPFLLHKIVKKWMRLDLKMKLKNPFSLPSGLEERNCCKLSWERLDWLLRHERERKKALQNSRAPFRGRARIPCKDPSLLQMCPWLNYPWWMGARNFQFPFSILGGPWPTTSVVGPLDSNSSFSNCQKEKAKKG